MESKQLVKSFKGRGVGESRFRKANNRRSERGTLIGRQMELEVEQLLSRMKDEGTIFNFIRHEPNSPEDGDGRDFTVIVHMEGKLQKRSFGVTTSSRSLQEARMKHPNVPQMYWPYGRMKPETMVRRIVELFNEGV